VKVYSRFKTTVTDHCGRSEGGLTGLYFGGAIELNVEPIQFRQPARPITCNRRI
jgi:hypothetical protein